MGDTYEVNTRMVDQTGITDTVPAIAGQMGHIMYALLALRQDTKVPPLGALKPGQLFKRIEDHLRRQGFHPRELPSRSTFDRFRRQYGALFGLT
jgi:hypothetical protein